MEYERLIEKVLQRKELEHIDKKSKEEIIESLNVYHEELFFQNEELKRKNEELLVQQDYYKKLFYESPVIYFHVDNEGAVLEYNHLAKKYFGYLEPIDVINKIFHANSQDHFYFYNKSLNKQRDVAEIFKVNSKEGVREVRLVHTISEIDHSIYYAMIDVTKEIEQLEIIKRVKNEAVLLNKSKNIFLARISHELRNPINSLFGLLELYKDLDKEYYQIAKEQLNHLYYLISETLDYSVYESGKVDIQKKQVNLSLFLNSLVESHQIDAKEKGLIINKESHIPQGIEIFIDYAKMYQIADNLLTNAIKYTDTGAITVKLNMNEENLILTVSDTGIGIKKDYLNRIFSPFEQIETSTDKLLQGVGLGLSIVKELAEAMGCSIDVKSEFGKGSDFTLLMPRDKYPTFNNVDKTEEILSGFEQEDVVNDVNSNKPHAPEILLVEDDPVNRMILSKVLERHEYHFDTAENGQEAVDLVRQKRYDIIFMDCQMPVLDGYEATRMIRQDQSNESIRIVAMTAYAQEGDKEKCFYYGMNDYISKPITDYNELFSRIDSMQKN